jgi:hypothetical protein
MINEQSKSICQLFFLSSEQVLKFISNCVRALNESGKSNELAESKCKINRESLHKISEIKHSLLFLNFMFE